jgi:predicted transcriptional regulator
MIANDLATGSVPQLKLSDSVVFALQSMEEWKLSHLPVCENSEFLGLIAEKDCLACKEYSNSLETAGLPLQKGSLRAGEHIFRVAEKMEEWQVTLVPVTDGNDQYIGSVTGAELLHALVELISLNHPGSIIVLIVKDKDYLPSEIAQIVESNDGRILHLSVGPATDKFMLEVTLKINLMDIGAVLQTFSRYNYVIRGSWAHDDSYTANLHERFDALMNYLNI